MTRTRKSNPLGLPSRVYYRHGKFRYLDPKGHWHTLGAAWDTRAKAEWVRLTAEAPVSGTVAELLNEYIERFARFKRSPRTYADHKDERKPLLEVFRLCRPQDVAQTDIAQYLELRGRTAPVRANREIALLSSAFSYGMRTRFPGVAVNPCYGVRRNEEHPRTRYVKGEELRAFCRVAPRWLRCYVLLKYLTGLRQGDMLRLARPTDRRIEVRTGKTGRVLNFRWTWALRTVVDAAKAIERPFTSVYLFTTQEGNPMRARAFKSAWARAMKKYIGAGGERFSEHDIRAKTASDSKTLQEAQERLAHSSAQMTQRYRRGPAKVRPLR